jgi:hypothetical protein
LNVHYRPSVGAYDEAPPKLDVPALREALHKALAALDAEGADDEGSFTEVENRPSNHRAGERGSGTFTKAKDKFNPYTNTGADKAMSFDARLAVAKVRTPEAFSGSDFYSEFGITRAGRPQ